ncbi:helix-turn-helix domain-containing protein [Methanomethylophilus alvi]|uniref:helix-turn-helix domain-containing protein n=1 Tax=Methanomethylophilus alvi TaxID=1291540 RepID=UPI0037DC254B
MDQKRSIKEIVDEYSNVSRVSKCLGISRPSIYRYMERYDNGEVDKIPKDVLNFFNTVCVHVPESSLRSYFTEKYNDYLDEVDKKKAGEPVPKDIAETIDRLGMTVDDIDERINNALEVKARMDELGYSPERSCVKKVERDLQNLQYTRDLIEKWEEEKKFWPITEGDMHWYASTGVFYSDYERYTQDSLEYKPGMKNNFKCCKLNNKDGYSFVFDGCCDDDEVELVIEANVIPGQFATVGKFKTEPNQRFIMVPKFFDPAYAYAFQYRAIRIHNGERMNEIRGMFN